MACLPALGVRQQYFDLPLILARACPHFHAIDWAHVRTQLLIGACEVVNGLDTVFDSNVNKGTRPKEVGHWRQRLPVTLASVAASGTLPTFRPAECIDGRYYWDGLYSQNPPVREFVTKADPHEDMPDEIWVVRINPQQWPELPETMADIQDRQNELMGNLSLHQELDFILAVNRWHNQYKNESFAEDHKPVTVRTIKMKRTNRRRASLFVQVQPQCRFNAPASCRGPRNNPGLAPALAARQGRLLSGGRRVSAALKARTSGDGAMSSVRCRTCTLR